MRSQLQPFQHEVLEKFFEMESRFFLTGGAALSGFYLKHRETHDLDLFSIEDVMEEGTNALTHVARSLGASMESLRTSPDFRRFLISRGNETVIVDLVHDLAPQLFDQKLDFDGVRVDPAEEIAANKLCALLSRSEIRDLVDLRELERAGHSLELALERARIKDGGLTPAQLAWVLSSIEIGDDAQPPGGIDVVELRDYISSLVARLNRLAWEERELSEKGP